MQKSGYKKRDLYTLVELAQNGDVKALEYLIRKNQNHIYAVFSYLVEKKHDISDLTQETLIKMAKSLPNLREIKSFKTWLDQIITSVYYDYTRKKAQSPVEINSEKLNEIKDKLGCEPGEKCLYSEVEKLIRASLLNLPSELRICLILREYEGLSYSDIAKLTNSAIGTVKSRISRARIRLQKELKEYI